MSDASAEDRSPSRHPAERTEPTAAEPPPAPESSSPESSSPEPLPRAMTPPPGAPEPPPPGPVFVPAGLGLPVGYNTPAPAPGGRLPGVPFARRKFSLLVVGAGVVLGVLAGGVAGVGATALAAGDHHERSQLGTSRGSEGGSVGERGGSDANGR